MSYRNVNVFRLTLDDEDDARTSNTRIAQRKRAITLEDEK